MSRRSRRAPSPGQPGWLARAWQALRDPPRPPDDGAQLEERVQRGDLLTVAGVTLASLVVFVLTSAPGIVTEGDAAEFTASAYVGGIAHPPGYPGYIFVGWLLSFIVPALKLARVLNLLSALAGAASCGLLTAISLRLLRRWEGDGEVLASRLAAAAAGLLLASSREFWTQSLSSEVYTLSMAFLLAALFINLTAWGERHPWAAVGLLAFGYGVHHTLIVLSVPIAAELIVRAQLWRRPRALAQMALALVLGASIYLYLPLRSLADPPTDFVNPETWEGFVSLVTMQGMPSVNPELRSLAVWADQFGSFFRQWWRQHPFWAYPLFALGLGLAWRRRPWTFHWLVLAIFLATTWGYITITNFEIGSSFENEVRVFYLPGYAMACFWGGLALHWLLRRLPGPAAGALTSSPASQAAAAGPASTVLARALPAALGLLLALGWLYWMGSVWHAQDKSRNYIAYNYGKDLLETVRDPALIFTPGDNAAQPILYLQRVEGYRTNVAAVHLPLIPFPWYHDMLRRMYPDLRIPQGRPSVLSFIQANLGARNIYFARAIDLRQIPGYRLDPEGILLRVVREDAPRQPPPLPLRQYPHLAGYQDVSTDLRERSILTECREGLLRQGTALLELGYAEEALRSLEYAQAIPPQDFVGDEHMRAYLRLQLASTYLRLGKLGLAQSTLERLQRERPDFAPARQALQRLEAYRRSLPQPPAGVEVEETP